MLTRQQILEEILSLKIHIDIRGNLYGKKYENYLSTEGGMWQLPEELTGLMEYLQTKDDIKTFLNIGTFNGLTFTYMSNFLNRKNQVNCITVDPYNYLKYADPRFKYLNATSDVFTGLSFDLVFIDGHHAYQYVKKDYENVGINAKYVIFHDIEDELIRNEPGYDGGVPRFWEEIKQTRKYIEFLDKDKPNKIMGIGLLYG